MYLEIKEVFDARIKEKLKDKKDVQKFLLNHERKNICLDNLCVQIRIYELGRTKLSIFARNAIIRSCADMFMSHALDAKAKEIMSLNALKAKEQEASQYKELKEELEKENEKIDYPRNDRSKLIV